MPYKTKTSKVAASHRRLKYIQTTAGGVFSYEKTARNEASRNLSINKNTINDQLYLKGDLLKIVIVSVAIVAFQITLSLTLF